MTLGAATHLSPPPAHANQKKTPVMEEFRFFAFEGMADELQDPAHYEKASRVHPEAVNEYRGQAQSQRNHDHGNAEAVAGSVYRMSMTARVLRNPLLVGASTQHGFALYIRYWRGAVLENLPRRHGDTEGSGDRVIGKQRAVPMAR